MDKTYVFEGFLNDGNGSLSSLWHWKEEIGVVDSDRHILYISSDCNIFMNRHEDVRGVHYLHVKTDKTLRFALNCLRKALRMCNFDFYVNPCYKVNISKDDGTSRSSSRFFRDPLVLPQ